MKLADVRDSRILGRKFPLPDLALTTVVQVDQYNVFPIPFPSCSTDIPQLLMIL